MDSSISVFLCGTISNDLLKTLLGCVIVIALHLSIFVGFLYGVVIIVSYILGAYLFHLLLTRVRNADEILSTVFSCFLHRFNSSNNRNVTITKPDCRNAPLIIPISIDNALERLLNRILDQYVTHWYSTISTDPNFQYEIRCVIRNVISVCYRRISKVEIENFLLRRVLPIILDHIAWYENLKRNDDVHRLHIAAHSRTAEILYVQNVSKCILGYFVSKSGLRCKSYYILLREILSRSLLLSLSDAVCNPAALNALFLHFLNGDFQLWSSPEGEESKTELLNRFVSSYCHKLPYSSIRPDVSTIVKDRELSEVFMSFLKNNNADNLLQFCIDIENYNERIQKWDVGVDEVDRLISDAWDLYSVYFKPNSPNCINFEKDLATPLSKALSKDILKVRTTNAFHEAHEYVFSLLDSYCFEFHNSSEFYSWLYGTRESTEEKLESNRSSSNLQSPEKRSSERKPGFEFGNKLNRIKDVLKPNVVQDGQIQICEDGKLVDCDVSITEMGEEAQLMALNDKNLNNWMVTIPTVGSRLDPVTNKVYTVFVINVQSRDSKEWIVERRPMDLYALDMKLTEFHGPAIDAQLPHRRLLTSRLESIQLYEEYLNKLIKNDVLRHSELLHTFLTSPEEFELETMSLGKLFRKSVVPTLRKERGQNLESFIYSFVNSCRTTKYEWKDVNEKQTTKSQRVNTGSSDLYGNNFDIDAEISKEVFFGESSIPQSDPFLARPSTCMLYLGVKAFNVRINFAKYLLSLQNVFGGIMDTLLLHWTKNFIQKLLTSYNIAYLVNLIEKILFDNRSKPDAETVKKALINGLNKSKNSWSYPLNQMIHENIQDAKLNKQLFYKLLDVILAELFPELMESTQR